MGGCGTHLVLEMFERVGVSKLVRPVLLLQAIHLARHAPSAPCPLIGYVEMSARDAVAALCREMAIAPIGDVNSDDAAFDTFAKALAAEGANAGSRQVIGHHYYFSHTFPVETADGRVVVWTTADRDAAQDLLERASTALGIELRQAALVRNPVDIYLSQQERYADQSQRAEIDPRTIEEFFGHVGAMRTASGLPVVRYEDICAASEPRLRELLRALHFTTEDIAGLDLSVIHLGGIDKWALAPRATIEPLIRRFDAISTAFGYTFPKAGALRRARKRWHSYRSEFRAMNAIFRGDFSADAAFSRHRRSLPARAWFRLMLCIPSRRRNMTRFYRERKNSGFPARPLFIAIGDVVRSALHRSS